MAKETHPHRVALIHEHASKHGGRLGRHVHFDDRSWDYPVLLKKHGLGGVSRHKGLLSKDPINHPH